MPTRIIETDVTDWDDDFQNKEPDVITNEEIIERRKEGMHSAEIGRHILIARERGLSDKDILSSNKVLLQLALVMETNRKTAVSEDENEDSQEDVAIVDSSSSKGTEEAIAYLLKIVPGYIYGRLAIIANNDEDAQGYADELKSKIDEIMVKLG